MARVCCTHHCGKIEVTPGGRVLSFLEKNDSGRPGWINAGTYIFNRDLIGTIPEGVRISLERELIPKWLRQHKHVFGFPSSGMFVDIGTPESYRKAQGLFRQPDCVPADTTQASPAKGRK
jgi:NDP-sugar pyrophosphorylase family protein